ncbi:ABC transporter permease [Nesterenkonia muleiensis]|uniref:ABC transporter permease n=1 Tax=Nesterenkonia muleiensis TaxID=2282648 RepID=UPI0013005A08|nr:ABC transporter permease [Nesterenkonia muleiensis]
MTAVVAAPNNPVAIFGRFSPVVVVSVLIIVVFTTAAILAPWIATHNPNEPDLLNTQSAPTGTNWLGTDNLGRDLFSRMVHGARSTIFGPVLVITVATTLGVSIAMVAAWCGGIVDQIIARFIDVMFSVPTIIVALIVVMLTGAGLTGVVIGLSIAYVPYYARLIRSAAMKERSLPYVDALWLEGRSGLWIVCRHIIPNISPLILTQSIASLGLAIIDITALSFLGLGVQSPDSDWGVMVRNGIDGLLSGRPYESLFAGLAIVLFAGSVNVLGNHLSRRFEV